MNTAVSNMEKYLIKQRYYCALFTIILIFKFKPKIVGFKQGLASSQYKQNFTFM